MSVDLEMNYEILVISLNITFWQSCRWCMFLSFSQNKRAHSSTLSPNYPYQSGFGYYLSARVYVIWSLTLNLIEGLRTGKWEWKFAVFCNVFLSYLFWAGKFGLIKEKRVISLSKKVVRNVDFNLLLLLPELIVAIIFRMRT